eukprot:Hpha_TRINITY_DN15357_c0_g1::TRINITY_DN15357_c0_g1_i1::g.87985::m.87985
MGVRERRCLVVVTAGLVGVFAVSSAEASRIPSTRFVDSRRRGRALSGGGGSTAHGGGGSTAGTKLELPQGSTGWADFCEELGKWEPADGRKPAAEPCVNNTLDECAKEKNCVFEHNKCMLSHQCFQRQDQEGCGQLHQCLWSPTDNLCRDKVCPDWGSAADCMANRKTMHCMYNSSAGKCLSCGSYGETSCPMDMCEWHAAGTASCKNDPMQNIKCGGDLTQGCSKGCAWDGHQCSPFDCTTLATTQDCATESICQWHTGDCTAPQHLSCGNFSYDEAVCDGEHDCTWYSMARCVAPWCLEFENDEIGCVNAVGCDWDKTKGKCNTAVSCSGQPTESSCLSRQGCEWKLRGCHSHAMTCTGKPSDKCESLEGCEWQGQVNCSASNCTGLNQTACKDYKNDHGTEICTWTAGNSHSPGTCTEGPGHHDEHHEHPPPYNILVIFVIGGLGAFFRHNFSDSRLPYTVILFMTGAAFAGLAQWEKMSFLKKFTDLQEIDPHLLFYIFLPVLIFESAFAVDWFVFRTVLGHALILAGPGICTATALTGMVAKYIFDYNWTWLMCLLFGVTLSATDPVAVVALLKELGASPQISTLIEGESLLNDGTAIVFFNILSAAIAGCSGEIEDSWDSLLLEMIKVAGGGPLLGYVCAIVSVFCLGRVFNDPLIEITTSLVTAYVTFFVAEAYFHVSGVLAVVVCGVYMSHRRQCISPEVHHTLHEFWEMAVYLGNTLIFAIAGMIVAGKAFAHVELKDFAYLLITYIAINVIRLVNLKFFACFYNRFDYKLEGGNMALVCWGGLRGAVGLALALIIAGDSRLAMRDPNDPRTILQTKLVFYTAMIVVLTLLVNGVTTQNLVKHFKLDQVSDTKKRMMKENFRRLRQGGLDQLEDLKTEGALYDVNWLEARKWVFDDMRDPYNKDDEFLGEGDPHAEAIMHYYKIMHSSVWEQNEEGLLDGDAVRFLLSKINEKEKAAKKKEAEQLEAAHALVSTGEQQNLSKIAHAAEEEEMDPLVPSPGTVEVTVEYTAGGRTIVMYLMPTATILQAKKAIYQEENIPLDQQRVLHQSHEMENTDRLRDVPGYYVGPAGGMGAGKVELQLDRRNPDEDVLMNANILEEFWHFDWGWYGHVEKLQDKIQRLGGTSFLEKKWTYGFNVAMALVIAHNAVLNKIDNLADPGEANKLKTHAKKVKREVLTQLVHIAKKASKTSTAMKTTLAARTVLNHARSKVWDWQKEGLIEDTEAGVLVRLVEQKMKELTKADNKMPSCNPDYILSQMEWYQKASSELRDQLRQRRKIERFRRGEAIIRRGDEHSHILLITAGSARVHVSRRFDYVGPGYCAGLLSALTSTNKYCDIYAETDMSVLSFKADSILNMMNKKGNEAFYQALWRCAGIDVAYKLLRGMEPYSKWPPREVRKFVNRGRLLELPKYRPEDKKVQLGHGCYHVLISGIARDATNTAKDAKIADLEALEAPCLLPTDCHEVYLQSRKWRLETSKGNQNQWFAADEDEAREDEVQVLIVEDPSSASARARKYWEKIYKKIRSIKTTAALRGANVKTALMEAFGTGSPGSFAPHPQVSLSSPYDNRKHLPTDNHDLKAPLLGHAGE